MGKIIIPLAGSRKTPIVHRKMKTPDRREPIGSFEAQEAAKKIKVCTSN
jgi:hypothetical protein